MKEESKDVDELISSAIDNHKRDSINTMLDAYELNWRVVKKPMQIIWSPDEVIKSPHMQVMREDTRQVFWASKDAYEVFQNQDLAELLFRIAEQTGYELHGGGMFSDGARVFLQLITGEEKGIGKNKDVIKKFLTAINSHDGQTSMRWGLTNVTISCTNTFNRAYSELKSSARHTKTMHQRIDDSLKKIEMLNEIEDGMFKRIHTMASEEVTQKNMTEVIERITGVDMLLTAEEITKNYSTYAVSRMTELLEAINQEMEQKGNTTWGLFSGVTKYTSHVMPVGKKDGARVESKYAGSGYKLDNVAYEILNR